MMSGNSIYKTAEELNDMNGKHYALTLLMQLGEQIIQEFHSHVVNLSRKRQALAQIGSHLDSPSTAETAFTSNILKTPTRHPSTPNARQTEVEMEGFGSILMKLKADVELAVDKYKERQSDQLSLKAQLETYKNELSTLKNHSLELEKLKSVQEIKLQELMEYKELQTHMQDDGNQREEETVALNHLIDALKKEIKISFDSRSRLELQIQELHASYQEIEQEDLEEMDEKEAEIGLLKRITRELQDQAKLSFARHDEQTNELVSTIDSLNQQLSRMQSQMESKTQVEQEHEIESKINTLNLQESLASLQLQLDKSIQDRIEIQENMDSLYENLELERLELETKLNYYKRLNSSLSQQIRICFSARDELHVEFNELQKEMQNELQLEREKQEKEMQLQFQQTLKQKDEFISDLEKRCMGLQNLLQGQREEMDYCQQALKSRSESCTSQETLSSPIVNDPIVLNELKTLVSVLQESESDLKLLVEKLNLAVEEKDSKLNELHNLYSTTQSQLEKTEKELIESNVKNQELQELVESKDSLVNKIESYQYEVQSLSTLLKDEQQNGKTLKETFDLFKRESESILESKELELQEMSMELQTIKVKNETLEKKLENQNQQYAIQVKELEFKVNQTQESFTELQNTLEAKELELKELGNEKDDMFQRVSELTEISKVSRERIQISQSELEYFKLELENFKTQTSLEMQELIQNKDLEREKALQDKELEFQNQLDLLQAKVKELESTSDGYKTQYTTLDGSYKELHDFLKELQSKVSFNSCSSMTNHQEWMSVFIKDLKDFKSSHTILSESKLELETALDELKMELENLKKTIETDKTLYKNQESLLSKNELELNELQDKLRQSQDIIFKLESESCDLTTQNQLNQERIQSLESELTKFNAKQSLHVSEVQEYKSQVQELELVKENLEKNIQAKTMECIELKKNVSVSASLNDSTPLKDSTFLNDSKPLPKEIVEPIIPSSQQSVKGVSSRSKRVLESVNTSNSQTPINKRTRQGPFVGGSTKKSSSVVGSKGAVGTPAPDLSKKRILICFSGFKEATGFNSDLKNKITQAIKRMPDAVLLSSVTDDFDTRTTHVIAPAHTRTLKTFGASLKGAWLISDPQWVFDSLEKGTWQPEFKYGYLFESNPFQGKKCFIAPSFYSSSFEFRRRYLQVLITECARGCFVENVNDADIIFKGDKDPLTLDGKLVLDWFKFTQNIGQPPK